MEIGSHDDDDIMTEINRIVYGSESILRELRRLSYPALFRIVQRIAACLQIKLTNSIMQLCNFKWTKSPIKAQNLSTWCLHRTSIMGWKASVRGNSHTIWPISDE